MVCAVDHLAAQAGVQMLQRGGSAADAAIATNAALAVTTQHMCGLGGDLFALVHVPGDAAPYALNASGRSGSGADLERLRADGHTSAMPLFDDIRAVPVPGCVDGWAALHARFGKLPLREVLEPARLYAADGFPASQTLARVAAGVATRPGGEAYAAATHPGAIVRRPGVARTLEAIADGGRDERYRGGGTIYLCAVDNDRMGVSLIQSNAAGFGSMLAEPTTGIFLQNRGIGFSVEPGHPAAYGPRRRPPHTLSPALVTTDEGALDMVIG